MKTVLPNKNHTNTVFKTIVKNRLVSLNKKGYIIESVKYIFEKQSKKYKGAIITFR